MSYTVELPDGKVVEFPDSVSREQAAQIIRQQLGTGAAPKTGLGAALSKGAANLLSSGRTGIESLFGDATQAGRAGVARGKDISRNYADQVSLDRVTDAYKQRGFLPAVGEAISQIPASLAEQAPNIAATAGGAFTGARLGALVGPYGAVVGGGIGALVPSFVQQFGSNVERQVQEAPGQPVSTGRAAAAGAGQAVLDVAATAIPLGKTILGKILGSKVEQAFLRGDKAAAEALAKESLPKVLAKGTGVGVAAEAPTEVVQAVLERAQAGLPLTSDDALKEYAENAYGAALLSPIGAAGRVTDRSSARDTLESESKKRAIEEARKLKESPEYIQKIATEYEAAQAAFNEAKQGLGKYPKKGTEVEKLEWREKYKQLGLLQNEISDLAPEYRELKPKIDEMRSREQAEAKAAEDAMWMGLRGEAPQGTPETEAPKLVDISALEEALTKEKNATTSEIENAWMEGAGRRRRTPIEEAVYDAVTTSVLDADAAASIVETALKEGRPDLALYAAKRAARAADSMSTTPGVSEGSPKYESIKKNLVESKQKAQAAARQLLEKATSTAAPVAPPAPANPYEEIGQGIARAYEQRRRAAAPPEQADWENLGVTTPLSAEARKDRNEFVVQQGVAAAQANPELAQNLLASKGKLEIPGLTPQDVRAIYDALNKKVKEDADLEKRRAKAKPAPSTFSLTGSPQQANENLISAARDLQQPNREVVEAEREALLRMGAKPAEGPTALLKKVFGQKDDLTQKSPDLQFVADQLMGQVPRVPPAAENIPGRQRQGLGRTPTRITLQEIVDQMRVKAKALSAARETRNSQAINALRDELADLRAKAQEAEANGGFLYTRPQEPTPEQEAFERTTDTRPVTFAPMATPIAPAAPKTGDTITIDGKPAAKVEGGGVAANKFDPKGLKPGTPEYNVAFDKWSSEQQGEKAAQEVARQRQENKAAVQKRNGWRAKLREWFLAAKDGDTISDVTGQTYKVIEKTRRDGTKIKSLAAVDEKGNSLGEGRATTGISQVGDRIDGLNDGGIDDDTGSALPETAGQSLASGLGKDLEDGNAKTATYRDGKATNPPTQARAGTPAEGAAKSTATPAAEEQVSTKTSEKTGNTTKTYGGYVDGDGVPVELSIVRRADGTLFRVFAKYGDGIRSELDASYGPGITDEQIVKAVAEPSDWEKVAAKSMATPAAEERGQPQRVAQQPGPETALQAAQKKSVAERTELADKAEQLAQTPGLPRARVNALRTLQRALLSGERDAKAARPILERLSRGIETPAPPAEEPQIPTKTVTERRVAMPEGVVADVAPAKKKDTERQTKQGLPTEVVVKRAEPLSDEELDREETRAARRAAIKTVQRKTEEAVQASEKAVDDIYATIDRQDLASVTYWSDKMQLEIAELEAASRAAGDDFPKADEAKLRRARTVLKQLEDSQKQLRAAANNAREGTEEKQAERRAAREAERLQAMDEAAKYFKVAEQQDELVALYQSRVNELRSDLISKLIDHNVAMQKIKDLKPIGRELLGVPLDALEDAVTQQRELFTDAIERAHDVRDAVPQYTAAIEALEEEGGSEASGAEAAALRATAEHLSAEMASTEAELDLLNRTFETTRAARDVGRLQKQLLSADDVKPTEAELDEYQRALSKAQEREATARAKASEAERTLTRLASEDRLAQEKAAEAARDARLARERQQAEALIEAKERGAGTQYRMLNPVERAFREGAFDVSEEIEQLRAEAIAAGVPKKQLLAQEKRTRQKSDVVSLNRSLGVARKDLAKVEKAIQEGEASMAKAPLTDEAGTRVFKLQKQLESLEAQFAKERSAEKRAVLLERINSLQDRIKNRTTGRDPAIEARLKQLREQQAEAEAAATEAVGQEERMQTRADAYLDRNERVPQILVDAIQAANMRWRAAETQSEALQEKIRKLEDIEPAKQAFKGQGALMRQRKLLEVRIAEYLDRLQDLGLSETDVAMGSVLEAPRAEAARKKLQQAINERKQRETAAVAAGTGEPRMTKQEAKAELAVDKPATSGEALEKSQAKKRLKSEKTAFTGTGGPSGVKALEQERDAVARAKVAADKKLAEQDAVQARADRAAEKRVRAELASVLPTEGALAGADSKVFIYPSVDAFLQTPEGAKYVGKITPNTKGVVLPEGKALLFADNIPEGRALGVLLHDVGVHLGFRKIFTAPELKALANVVRNWATRADNSVERKVGQAALKRVEDAKTPDSQVDEELIGYAVEEATNAGKAPSADKGPVTAWLNRIREKFVAALEKFVGRYNKGTLKLSAQDLVDMAYGAANMELRGVEPQARAGVVGAPTELMFSKSPKYSTDKAAAMGRIAESLVAPQKSMVDRIKLNALGLRTQLVDAMAPVEKFAEYLGKQTEDSLRATQLMFNVRMHGEISHFMGLAASTGVVRRQEVKRDDGRTEYLLRAEEGANLKDVMRELKDVPGMDPEAANINYSMHRIVKRYRGLSKRKPGATLESLFGTDAEGNPVVSMAKVLEFEKLLDESPDVKAAFERADAIYDQYNKDLMRFLAQSSAISPELADELTRYNDYVPYYRVRNGNVELVVEGMKEGPIRIGNIKDQPHLKELVGGNAAILDFSTSAANNTYMLLDMGLRNYAARSVAWELKKMGMGAIGSDKVAGEDVFFFYEKGELRSMRVATDALGIPADLLVKGMAGIPMMRFAALQMLGMPARILRQAVVLNPVYALRQVLRDSPASMMVAGANGIPVLNTMRNLKRTPTRDLLERSGVTGGQVYTGSTEDIGMVLRTVNDGKASWMQALRKLESMSMTADAATRAAQYDSYRKQGRSDLEATFMSMESMNFSKRGLSPSMHMVSTMIPFFNAQIQGLDVLYKAARGKMPLNERLKIRQKLFVRGAMLAAGTLAYAALMQDEDEYKNALPEEKYNNWFVRIPGVEPMVRIPIPFELGYIFKAMPEAAFNLLNGSEEGRTVAKAFGTIVKNTIPGGSSMLDVKGVPIPIPLPQAMKPAIEAALGKSFFTGRDIESAPERAMDPEKRVRDTTSGLAKELGELGGFSPVMIDYILRGYLSSIGPLLAQTVSLAIPTGDSPERVVRRLNEYPLVGPLFQPKDGTGVINLVYDRVNEIERAKKTFDDLVSKGNWAEAQQYLRENIDRLSMEGLAGNFTQVMKQVSQAEAAVRAAVGVKSISPQEGREILDKLRQRKIQIAESVKSQMAVRKELQAAR